MRDKQTQKTVEKKLNEVCTSINLLTFARNTEIDKMNINICSVHTERTSS